MRLQVLRLSDCTLRGGNILWIIRLAIFMGSLSGLFEKPFIMSKGAVWSVVLNILEFFFVSCTNLTMSRDKLYSFILKVKVGPLGFLMILK
jgi:hypothetical protein